MFNNYSLSDEDVVAIIMEYEPLINKFSIIDNKVNEDLKQEIILSIYEKIGKCKIFWKILKKSRFFYKKLRSYI